MGSWNLIFKLSGKQLLLFFITYLKKISRKNLLRAIRERDECLVPLLFIVLACQEYNIG